MISRDISLSFLLLLSALGCSEGEGEGPPTPDTICAVAQVACTGDTICGVDSCESAFDRSYQIRLTVLRDLGQCRGAGLSDPDCLFPKATVYFSDRADPIFGGAQSRGVDEIVVTEGSYLVADVQDRDCLIELTSERLRTGSASCTGGSITATLSLVAMPL